MANARKRQLWLDSTETLKSDPTLNEVHINSLVNDIHLYVRDGTSTKDRETIKDVFSQLSSGHKVVELNDIWTYSISIHCIVRMQKLK